MIDWVIDSLIQSLTLGDIAVSCGKTSQKKHIADTHQSAV